ncbi:MAG: flotillin family protein [Nevskia sp.]|nr:flotillin family protein [Nevskia sp.]
MDVPLLLNYALYAAGAIAGLYVVYVSRIVVFIGNDSIGVIEKLWSLRGSIKSGFIALDGTAGFQPGILRGGIHFFPPFQYRIHVRPLPSVPQGTIGYVFARSGASLEPGQTLGLLPPGASFEDARAFIDSGGQRGPQRQILREGVYPINVAQFVILTSEGTHAIALSGDAEAIHKMRGDIEQRDGFRPVVLRDREDVVGVVTVHDGPSLDHGQLIAATVGTDAHDAATYHNCFQDPERFLAAGGRRGRQEQVLVEGTYYLNRLFATVERLPKTVIDIGKVGVVVSYTGEEGSDLTGKDYKHGELVENGKRGVWSRALQAGKYALNPHGIMVIPVPTTNFVLRWIQGSSEEHGYDTNLAEIQLITKDAFEPVLPLSIVLHIAYEDAPRVVQQFADLKLLVEQTLDPMVSAYFKDAAQKCTLLELVSNRADIQRRATEEMKTRFCRYHLDLMEVMIGTPRPAPGDKHMATILDQLRARQVADEQTVTYENQRKAAEKEREMREAAAAAEAQGDLTRSLVQVQISENNGQAQLRLREREAVGIKITASAQAEAVKMTAGANAERIRVEGQAEADRTAAVGKASAESVAAQVKAFGGPEFQLRKEIAQILQAAIASAKVPLVPSVQVTPKNGGSGSPLEALLAMALAGRSPAVAPPSAPASTPPPAPARAG